MRSLRHGRTSRRSLEIGISAAIVAIAASTPARANGRYPAAGLIALSPGDPSRVLIRATYGVLTTSDGGGRWSWICEGAVGYNGFEDPMVVVTRDGSMVAGISGGLSATHDSGCQWDMAEGGLAQRNVVDVSTDRADPASVIALQSSVFAEGISTQVWESKDNARTWSKAGVDLPSNFLGVTLDSAPSDPRRLYVSGRWDAPTYQGVLQRSNDRGATWEAFDVPGSDDRHLPYLGAVDPKDPDILYVRVDGEASDALLVSNDGGATFREIFSTSRLLGLALSPDGTKIAAGDPDRGLWLAETATMEFTNVASLGVLCLTWSETGLFACADELKDGFTAGVSTDEGKTFSPLMTADRLCGTPASCGAESSTGQSCPALWAPIAQAIGGNSSCGGGASGGATTTASAASSGGDGEVDAGECACDAPGRPGAAGLSRWVLGAGIALLGARRRSARRDAARRLPWSPMS